MEDALPAGAGAGADATGTTAVHLEGLHDLGTGLGTLADQLGAALQAVDTLPIDAVSPVLGPVGADFLSALLDATARHREVLTDLTRVTGAAADLVSASGRLFEDTDAATATGLPSTTRATEV
ncbi:MAG TPA: hypothetical protein GX694_07060 [Actinomycetales bacterium]|nr:hypothetical protein [Actinomycetales bacterium]